MMNGDGLPELTHPMGAEGGMGARRDPVLATLAALVKDSGVYLLGAFVIGLGNVALVPLYIRYLAPQEFGVYALVDITILLAVTIAQLGLGVSYLKWYADLGDGHRGALIGATLSVCLATSIIGGGFLTLALSSSAGREWLENTDARFAWMILPIVVLEATQGILLADLRARRRSVLFSTAMVLRLLATVAASLWFIVVRRMGVQGAFLGRLVGDGIGLLLPLSLSLPLIRVRVVGTLVRPMVAYGFPIVWSALMAQALDAAGRYFLNEYSSLVEVGYYGAAIKIASVFQTAITLPFGIAWGGLMFQIAKWQNARAIYGRVLEYLSVLSFGGALAIAFVSPTIFRVFASSSYAPAVGLLPMVLLVRAISVLEYPSSVGIYLAGKTGSFIGIYSLGAAVDVATNLLLVPRFGAFGACAAWTIAWTGIILMMMRIGGRHYALDYRTGFLVIPGMAMAVFAASGAVMRVGQLSWFAQVGLSLLVGGAAVATVLFDSVGNRMAPRLADSRREG